MRGTILTPEIILPISSPPLKNSSIAVSDGKILDVDATEKIKRDYPDYNCIDKQNTVILPGFINAHTHLELGWIKNRIRHCTSFINWLEQIVNAKSGYIKKSVINESVEKGIRDLISSGVTTVGEISSYGGLDKPLLINSGLRTIIFKEIVDSRAETLESMSFESGQIYEERPFPHAPYSCSPEVLEKTFDMAEQKNIPVSIHLAESTDEVKFVRNEENGFENIIYPLIGKSAFKRKKAKSPLKYILKYLKHRKVRLSAVHMVQIDKEDIELVKKNDIALILCPRSNVLIKAGKPEVDIIKDIKRTGLGTDGLSSNINLDFFDEIRAINELLIEKKVKDSFYLSLYFATLGGARALFLEERIGSIEKGKDADLVCLDYDNKSPDPYEAAVNCTPEDLQFSMVRGNYIFNRSITG